MRFVAKVLALLTLAACLFAATLYRPSEQFVAQARAFVLPDQGEEAALRLNTCAEEELAAAPGLGAKTAGRIAAARPFYYFEDLLAVDGIGNRRLDALRAALLPAD